MYESSQSRTEWAITWLSKKSNKTIDTCAKGKKFYEWILDQDKSTLKKEIPSVNWVSATGKVGCIVVGFEFTGLSLQQCP